MWKIFWIYITFFFHARLEAFSQPTISTLIAFIFVNNAMPIESGKTIDI